MRKTICICDVCRKEIPDRPVKLVAEVTDMKTGEVCSEETLWKDVSAVELCDSCAGRLRRMVADWIRAGVVPEEWCPDGDGNREALPEDAAEFETPAGQTVYTVPYAGMSEPQACVGFRPARKEPEEGKPEEGDPDGDGNREALPEDAAEFETPAGQTVYAVPYAGMSEPQACIGFRPARKEPEEGKPEEGKPEEPEAADQPAMPDVSSGKKTPARKAVDKPVPPGDKPAKKRYYMTVDDKDEARKRYRAGEEMEEIADSIGVSLPLLSRFIQAEGLGSERYGGKAIPDKGSAPIPSAGNVTYFGAAVYRPSRPH